MNSVDRWRTKLPMSFNVTQHDLNEAAIFNNQATVYESWGDGHKALEYYVEA